MASLEVVVADSYYPSNKTCSGCGVVNAKLKREHRWRCEFCGTDRERNLNAAVDLCNLLTLPDRGATLRDGKALAIGETCHETSPDDQRTAPPDNLSRNADYVLTDRSCLSVNTPQ